MDSHTPELAKRLDALRARAAALGFIGAFIADDDLAELGLLSSGCWMTASSSEMLVFTGRTTLALASYTVRAAILRGRPASRGPLPRLR